MASKLKGALRDARFTAGLVLRRPFSFNTIDPATGTLSIHFRTVGRSRVTGWTCSARSGGRSRWTRAHSTSC